MQDYYRNTESPQREQVCSDFLQRANNLANKYAELPLVVAIKLTSTRQEGKRLGNINKIRYQRQSRHAYSTLAIYFETL